MGLLPKTYSIFPDRRRRKHKKYAISIQVNGTEPFHMNPESPQLPKPVGIESTFESNIPPRSEAEPRWKNTIKLFHRFLIKSSHSTPSTSGRRNTSTQFRIQPRCARVIPLARFHWGNMSVYKSNIAFCVMSQHWPTPVRVACCCTSGTCST